MPRLLFEKTGNAVWISHLDLMRLFQRAFKRAGLSLTHTQGFNPRPSVSIALPMSVGVESRCELLDFDLEGDLLSPDVIKERLNIALVEGVRVLEVYGQGRKIRDLALLACELVFEYDRGVPDDAEERIRQLFLEKQLLVDKRSKSGEIVQQDVIPLIRSFAVTKTDDHMITISTLVCCQNPALNSMQICAAISVHMPELKPDFCKCRRIEVYDVNETIFR